MMVKSEIWKLFRSPFQDDLVGTLLEKTVEKTRTALLFRQVPPTRIK